jgi:hypothetical protein
VENDECTCSKCVPDELATIWSREDPHTPTVQWLYVRYKSGKTKCLGKHPSMEHFNK